jgi:hypothetical protein
MELKHPKLDETVDVPEGAAGVLAKSGWKPVDQRTDTEREADEQAAHARSRKTAADK